MSLTLLPINPDPTVLAGSVIGGDRSATFDSVVTIYSPDGSRCREAAGSIDTRMQYSIVPGSILEELGIAPAGKQRGNFPDGSVVELPCALVRVALPANPVNSGYACILFGAENQLTVIGRDTLGSLGLAADPQKQSFVQVLFHL